MRHSIFKKCLQIDALTLNDIQGIFHRVLAGELMAELLDLAGHHLRVTSEAGRGHALATLVDRQSQAAIRTAPRRFLVANDSRVPRIVALAFDSVLAMFEIPAWSLDQLLARDRSRIALQLGNAMTLDRLLAFTIGSRYFDGDAAQIERPLRLQPVERIGARHLLHVAARLSDHELVAAGR